MTVSEDTVELTIELEPPVTPGDLECAFIELLEAVPGRSDMDDGFDVRRVPVESAPRKECYEPRSDGGWDHLEKVWRGDGWEPVGHEVLDEVAIETAAGVIGPEVR